MSGSGFGRASVFRSDRPRQIDHYIDFFGQKFEAHPVRTNASTTPPQPHPGVVGSNRRYTGEGHPVCAATRRRRDQSASGRQP
jgi:hypothetical protein